MKSNKLARYISMIVNVLKLVFTVGKILDCIGDFICSENS